MRTRLPIPSIGRRAARAEAPPQPNAVLALQRTAGNRATTRLLQRRAQTGYDGLKLGRNKAGNEVEIKREVGTLGGYDDRLQAISVARLAKLDPAGVGRDASGRWHPFELTGDFYGGTYKPGTGAALTEFYGLPSASGIATQQSTVASLKAHSGDVAAKLNDATRDLYALILGVEGGDILVNRTAFGRKGGKVNINLELAKDSNAWGRHGRESKQDLGFEPNATSAFELNPKAFDSPARAQAVLFHEVSHLKDYELTQRWIAEYEKGATFVRSAAKFFERWLKGKTNAADAQLVGDIAQGSEATTEARAYVRTAIAAFDVGESIEATAQLVAYAKGMAAQKVASPTSPEKNEVIKGLIAEWAAFRRKLKGADKKALDAVIATAVKENPKSWLANIKRG